MNKRVINQCKAMYIQIQNITPNIYAAVTMALHRKGFTQDEIEDVIEESQVIWEEQWLAGVDMPVRCLDETGIDVRRGI